MYFSYNVGYLLSGHIKFFAPHTFDVFLLGFDSLNIIKILETAYKSAEAGRELEIT